MTRSSKHDTTAMRTRQGPLRIPVPRAWPFLSGILLLALTAAGALAQTPPTPESKSAPAREQLEKKTEPGPGKEVEKKRAPFGLDSLRLPAGGILVLCEEAKDALGLLPRMIMMTPEDFQKLQEQIEQFKRLARADKTEAPSVCKLKCKIDGDLARIEARFEFRTERPRTYIRLGCQKAWPVSARMDDSTPWLQAGDEGLTLLADKPGPHSVVLDLLAPVSGRRGARGLDRGFELDLPRAAITLLERLELPAGVNEARLGARTVRTRNANGSPVTFEPVPVVPIDRLDVSWRAPAQEPAADAPVLAATQRIAVRINASEVLTETEITLQPRRGEASRWQLRLPSALTAAPELKAQPQDEGKIQAIEPRREGAQMVWEVRLREPSAEQIHLSMRLRQPRGPGPVPVEAILTGGALWQSGTIELHAPAEFRLFLQERPGLSRRELTEEQRREDVRAVFVFGSLAESAGASAPPLLTVLVEEVKGAVEVRTNDQVRLLLDGRDGPPGWQVTTRVEVTPIRTGVDRLELTLPPGFQFDRSVGASPAELIEDVQLDPANQKLLVKLTQKQTKTFSFTLPGFCPLADARATESALELPRPVSWGDEGSGTGARTPVLDRGGQIVAQVPDSLELLDPAGKSGLNAPLRGTKGLRSLSMLLAPLPIRTAKPGLREYTWTAERIPKRLELAWRPYRPELTADSIVDVSLSTTRARVRQRLNFHFGQQTAPAQVTLRGSPPVDNVEGGRFAGDGNANDERELILSTPVGTQHTVVLEYSVPITHETTPGEAVTLTLPIFQALAATRGRTKVRIWSDADLEVASAVTAWVKQPAEVVNDRDSLPSLVLGGGLEGAVPLNLTLTRRPGAALLVDRVLVRASARGGSQAYQVRFLLQRIPDHRLDLVFPVPLSRAAAAASLASKSVPLTFVDELGREVEVSRLARVAVDPERYRFPIVLEVTYGIGKSQDAEPLEPQGTLRPVLLARSILLGRVRWQVELPRGELPLLLSEGYTRELRWGWQGWLWGPRPGATAAELSQWLESGWSPAGPDQAEPDLVCWKTTLGPLGVTTVPLRVWLLACSLVALGLYLALTVTALQRGFFWLILFGAAGAASVAVLLWPDFLAYALFGSEPGIAVILVLVGIRENLRRKAHRQVVFMPGFQRRTKGSSVTRGDGSKVRRQPSTVDAPAPQAGSALEEPSR